MAESEAAAFPDGLTETHLLRVPLSKILSQDADVEAQLFETCQSHGFFYLDLTETTQGHALLRAADRLQQLAVEAFEQPDTIKSAVSTAKTQSVFGWKASGAIAGSDPHKRSDVGQFWNIGKDDILQNPGAKNVAYPSPIKEEIHEALFKDFVTGAHGVGLTILQTLGRRIGIAPEDLASRHRLGKLSGDHVRLTWAPGDPAAGRVTEQSEGSTRISTYGHTDFGTITVLFNWLGGLQIEDKETGVWQWVRPVKGHAIINLGDAMREFSGHRLASGKHRVVAAPGLQAKLERYSVVYFVRPENTVYMEDLTRPSQGVNSQGRSVTAGEWLIERANSLGVDIGKK